jgi:hypothetical protein
VYPCHPRAPPSPSLLTLDPETLSDQLQLTPKSSLSPQHRQVNQRCYVLQLVWSELLPSHPSILLPEAGERSPRTRFDMHDYHLATSPLEGSVMTERERGRNDKTGISRAASPPQAERSQPPPECDTLQRRTLPVLRVYLALGGGHPVTVF